MKWTIQMEKEYELDLVYWRTDANLHELERQLTKASEPLFDLEGGAKGKNLTTSEDSQPMIS